jgi:alcohol dehydrogenase, propanol-preferring
MTQSYRALEVTEAKSLRFVRRPNPLPGMRQVRIRVEACGVCHTDSLTVEGIHPAVKFPRAPGHEVVGVVEALGPDVTRWKVGQRVGVDFFGGEDGTCESCRRGDFINCEGLIIPGITIDGGTWSRKGERVAASRGRLRCRRSAPPRHRERGGSGEQPCEYCV